jgi:hypothetical protein
MQNRQRPRSPIVSVVVMGRIGWLRVFKPCLGMVMDLKIFLDNLSDRLAGRITIHVVMTDSV